MIIKADRLVPTLLRCDHGQVLTGNDSVETLVVEVGPGDHHGLRRCRHGECCIEQFPGNRELGARPVHLKKASRAWRVVSGCGGQPGINRSTGSRLSRPLLISSLPCNGPPEMAQAPLAMTTFGAGTAS